ncbi:DUF6154 family protein [Aquibacillus kalidii]|uniref:DUF6154 family protein n=1 Tax=Aquibacillus kalidii TaxID=2762597 RepID=UPI001644D0E5|nr:DUF6154 family protein [Aquibacillus kalidii]
MRFADDILQRYLRHFNENENDSLQLFIQSILEQMDHQDILEVFKSLSKEELNDMLGRHLSQSLVERLEQPTSNFEDDLNWRKVQ